MAFFLIGRGPDNDVRLLSNALFATRQDAMAELSRLSAEPSFEHWDAEVFVADLDQGAAVLLVRPATSPAEAEVQETQPEAVDSAPAADAWIADLPETPEVQAAFEDVPAEALEAPEAEGVPSAEVVAPSEDAEEHDDLREALLRTTAYMSAEGIEPPASAGLGEAEAVVDGGGIDETPLDEAAQPAEEHAAAAWPWDSLSGEAALEEPAPISAAIEPEDAIDEALIEPVTSARAPMSLGDHGEESPSDSEDSAPAQDESDFILDLDAIAPVALDSPIEDKHEPAPDAQEAAAGEPSDTSVEETDAPDLAEEPIVVPGPEPVDADVESAEAKDETLSPAADEDGSGAAEEQSTEPADVPALGTPSASSPLTDYTCDDCVYVATCPNRDQRLPKDCGSFQWR